MRFPSRKCACRRELSSHETAKSQIPFDGRCWLAATAPAVRRSKANSLISVRAGVSAGRSKHTMKPPETAEGSGSALRAGQSGTGRVKKRISAVRGPGPTQGRGQRVQGCGPSCKARSAMQSPSQAPQTRGTATALVVARSRKHNLSHANALWPACRAH